MQLGVVVPVFTPKPVRILSADDVKTTMKKQRYLVKGLIPRWGIGVIWGAAGHLKTFWVLDVVAHIALGREYQGMKVEQGTVVYCPFEGVYGMGARLMALEHKMGVSRLENMYLLADNLRFEKNALNGHKRLMQGISELGSIPKIVVLDTLHRSLVGGENNDDDMSFYINAATDIAQAFECFVLIVHHSGKSSDDLRGHSSLRGDADLLLTTKRMGEKGTSSDMVSVSVNKMKDGPEGTTVHNWVRIAQLGEDDDGEPMSSCYLEAAPAPQEMPKGIKGSNQDSKAFAVLMKLAGEEGITTMDQWRNDCSKIKLSSSTSRDASRMAFTRCVERLKDKGAIRIEGPYVYVVRDD